MYRSLINELSNLTSFFLSFVFNFALLYFVLGLQGKLYIMSKYETFFNL